MRWRCHPSHSPNCKIRYLNYWQFHASLVTHDALGNELTLLAALGYVLIERLRALALQGTALASAQVDTLRIKLLKVGAVITRNTRRIRLYLASNWPSADIFEHAVRQLRSP